MELHRIPNAGIMTMQERHITRLMLPALLLSARGSNNSGGDADGELNGDEQEDEDADLIDREDHRDRLPGDNGGHIPGTYVPKRRFGSASSLSQDILAKIYECLYNAAKSVDPGIQGHWPASYLAELARIRKANGRLSFGTQQLSAEHMKQVGDIFLDLIREKWWGKGAFFLHQFRGVRGQSTFPYQDEDQRQEAVRQVFSFLLPDFYDDRKWWIDVGIELQNDGTVIWWRRDALWKLLARLFLVSPDKAQQWTTQPHKYHFDSAAQLTQLGGFRFKPTATDRGNTHISYCQAYNTEKSVTYLLDSNRVAKGLFTREVFKKGKPAVVHYAKTIGKMFADAEDRHNGHARLEHRVRLDHAFRQDIFPTAPDEWTSLVICIDRFEWW
jgi:hypothetical protein